jgi:DnaJ like chaperone protein
MGAGKWIGGFLGFMSGTGPLGILAGVALGWLFDKSVEADSGDGQYSNDGYRAGYGSTESEHRQGERNSFLFSLLVLSSYIIRADGKVMHSEMELVRRFLRTNFGERAVSQGEEILLRLFDEQKRMGEGAFRSAIQNACGDIRANMSSAQRLQLLDFLVMIAKADGVIAPQEVEALRFVTASLGLSNADLDSMLNLGSGVSNLDAAYKVLGITAQATDAEVKAAYRQMALKHHPDRVATLGEDVRKAAERKFQEINEAKEFIYKHRGMS